MKKLTAILLCFAIACVSLTSCQGAPQVGETAEIVTTSHVVGDWILELAGESNGSVKLSLLADKGKDMHNFQPSAADIMKINRADMVVYVGGESDRWVEDVLSSLDGREIKVIRLLDLVSHGHDGECLDDHDHSHGDTDEHIWLSFENTKNSVNAISEALSAIDPENAPLYNANLEEYLSPTNALFEEYKNAVSAAHYKTLVFADRFPFVYLMEELGIEYLAAFPGCSSETVASFETVITLAKKIDELSLGCVLVIADSSDNIARTVVENTSAKSAQILKLDSMQVYKDDQAFDFLTTMRQNLAVLKIALGVE